MSKRLSSVEDVADWTVTERKTYANTHDAKVARAHDVSEMCASLRDKIDELKKKVNKPCAPPHDVLDRLRQMESPVLDAVD